MFNLKSREFLVFDLTNHQFQTMVLKTFDESFNEKKIQFPV